MIKKIIQKIKTYKLSSLNFRLLIYVFAITFIGIFTIGSAAEGENYQLKQIFGFLIGLFMLISFTLLSYKFLFKFYWIIYIVTNILLVLVLFLGKTSKGAQRWIDLGFTTFQPSEFAKIFLLIFFAMYLFKRKERLNSFKTLGGIVLFSAIPFALIFKEPDLSTTIVIFITFCAIMFLSEISSKIITAILMIAIPIVLIVSYFAVQPNNSIIQGYQYDRLVGFFKDNNSDDPEVERIRYQQENSLLAIGSGGLTGKGLDNNTITSVKNGNFLSEAHTDFIFTIVGEELGFIGSAAVILLIFLIVLECFISGIRALDLSGKLFCYGIGTLIAIQTFINIAVATMLLPNTGVTLPFVSYGLTSLVSLYCGIGIVLNIGLQRRNLL